jgi:hypothetical protein
MNRVSCSRFVQKWFSEILADDWTPSVCRIAQAHDANAPRPQRQGNQTHVGQPDATAMHIQK